MPKKTAQNNRPNPTYQASIEDRDWLDVTPVGREFGSPDYERLMALDQAAFDAFQSWKQVWMWLTAPNSQLGGECPEAAARSPEGLSKVMSILRVAGGRVSDDFMREFENLPVQERDTLKGL